MRARKIKRNIFENNNRMRISLYMIKKREAMITKKKLNEMENIRKIELEKQFLNTKYIHSKIQKQHELCSLRQYHFRLEKLNLTKKYFNKHKKDQENYIISKMDEVNQLKNVQGNLESQLKKAEIQKLKTINEYRKSVYGKKSICKIVNLSPPTKGERIPIQKTINISF